MIFSPSVSSLPRVGLNTKKAAREDGRTDMIGRLTYGTTLMALLARAFLCEGRVCSLRPPTTPAFSHLASCSVGPQSYSRIPSSVVECLARHVVVARSTGPHAAGLSAPTRWFGAATHASSSSAKLKSPTPTGATGHAGARPRGRHKKRATNIVAPSIGDGVDRFRYWYKPTGAYLYILGMTQREKEDANLLKLCMENVKPDDVFLDTDAVSIEPVLKDAPLLSSLRKASPGG